MREGYIMLFTITRTSIKFHFFDTKIFQGLVSFCPSLLLNKYHALKWIAFCPNSVPKNSNYKLSAYYRSKYS